MKAAAYCRVSTKSEEQLDSLASQQKFFLDYAGKYEFELVHIYADEGKSGTKMKNRTELLRMLKDAGEGEFEVVLIKDISRLARNTVDFLTSIRKLKAWGIKVVFVNYDQTSSESSEFMLTMLSAIAQEESANTSKRVKFGKKQNARLGRVPNLVYGYDKVPGEYFDLRINEQEAGTVKRIFSLYTKSGKGAFQIANILNSERIRTKRGCLWNQASICRILDNEIYTGKVINGKEEIEDFLTGKRKKNTKNDWYITDKPELRIIEEETFKAAQKIKQKRRKDEKELKFRESYKHPFSKLIVCSHCKGYFRRITRTYKNTVNSWVCGTRNQNGAQSCQNALSVKEEELLSILYQYFKEILEAYPSTAAALLKEGEAVTASEFLFYIQELEREKVKREKERDRYIELYTHEVISLEELKLHTDRITEALDKLKEQLKKETNLKRDSSISKEATENSEENKRLESYITQTFSKNMNLKRILKKVEADKEGNIVVYIKNIG
ncbi:recombinase family protein [Anaerocolumna xylanovorans]|uniref:Site-specific DNA recombinase n=1 Tax=Anaerocolumna xylanovorans DSM 12503 TaxID=1121345 RepID=A0A1M7Y9X3_9FIRM|nr:recombinase family protein [Anaerocolumna xylanovorans]SHO49434.1 Site-specific DNA recombinase [Anaerocolumna xylanovorans DSM 12503]